MDAEQKKWFPFAGPAEANVRPRRGYLSPGGRTDPSLGRFVEFRLIGAASTPSDLLPQHWRQCHPIQPAAEGAQDCPCVRYRAAGPHDAQEGGVLRRLGEDGRRGGRRSLPVRAHIIFAPKTRVLNRGRPRLTAGAAGWCRRTRFPGSSWGTLSARGVPLPPCSACASVRCVAMGCAALSDRRRGFASFFPSTPVPFSFSILMDSCQPISQGAL